ILLAFGLVPLSFAWTFPVLKYVVIAYDILLIAAAAFDYFRSRKMPEGISIEREFTGRFAIAAESPVILHLKNEGERDVFLTIKDEYPPEMELCRTREADIDLPARSTAEFEYSLKPSR